jgi:hypothetical protein
MSLISVCVKRKGAAHHQDGSVYHTGQPFLMDEEQFNKSVPGLLERSTVTPEQIKSKELPPGEPAPATSPAAVAIQDPNNGIDAAKSGTADDVANLGRNGVKGAGKLSLTKK